MSNQKKDDPRPFAGMGFIIMAVGFVFILAANIALGISLIVLGVIFITLGRLSEGFRNNNKK